MRNEHHHESPCEPNAHHPLALLGCLRRATCGHVVGMLVRIVGFHYIETARQYVVAFFPLTPDRRARVRGVRGVPLVGASNAVRAPWMRTALRPQKGRPAGWLRFSSVSWIPMGIIRARRKSETRVLLLEAGLRVFAERGVELGSLDEVADAAGFTKGAIYRQFPSKGAFLLALFEQYAAVARAGPGARRAPWFVPLTLEFAARAVRDPLLRRRLAVVLREAPVGGTSEGLLLRALARLLATPPAVP